MLEKCFVNFFCTRKIVVTIDTACVVDALVDSINTANKRTECICFVVYIARRFTQSSSERYLIEPRSLFTSGVRPFLNGAYRQEAFQQQNSEESVVSVIYQHGDF
jgi:hypothetical protein